MKLSSKIYIGSAVSLAIFGGICAADPGGLVTSLTRASQSQTEVSTTDPSSSQSATPSDTQTTPDTTPSDLGQDVATSDPSTVSSGPIAVSPKPVYGNCRHFSDGSTYTCEIPQASSQTALATAPAPDPTPTPVLTDQERQDVTVPNNNQDQTPTPTPTPDPNVQQDPAQ